MNKGSERMIGVEQTAMNEDEKALADFLLDIECLNPLAKYTSGVNVFDVLKISKTEIRHSNMLAWLLNPNENHGLGDQFIRGIFQCLVEKNEKLHADIFRILTADFSKFTIRREYNNIDLLLTSTIAKVVLCIENKIDSNEHDNQLQKYYSGITKEYPGDEWLQLFVFLSPDGHDASDPDNWIMLSYSQIADILQRCMEQNELVDDCRMILEQYLKIIRRDIVTDKELIEICNSIYTKHQRALDLIFENRPDASRVVYDIILKWCKEKCEAKEIIFNKEDSNKSCLRFSTNNLNTIYPLYETTTSGWSNKHPAFYEINNNNKRVRVVCTVSSVNLPDDLQTRTQTIWNENHSKSKSNNLKENWEWKRIFSTKKLNVEKEEDMRIDGERIRKYLDNALSEIVEFERKSLELLGIGNDANVTKEESDA